MSKLPRTWLPLGLTLLALAIRLHHLTYHSLWFDEAMSVHWARSSVSRILEVSMNLVEDRLPPLYYLFLHYWRLLVGDGEVAVRLPSVLLGTLLIPLVYRLATDLFDGPRGPFDRRVGSLAAALTALNPFLVWYSQEARMYAQAVLLTTLGTWFFLQARGRRHLAPAYWLAYGLCGLASLYTHLYTGFALIAHALYLLVTYPKSRWAWLPFAMTMLVVAVLFAPLALAAWRVSGEAGPGDPLTGFWVRAWWLLNAFTVWKAPLSPLLSTTITTAIAGFAVVGLLAPVRLALQSPAHSTQFPPPRRQHMASHRQPGDVKPLHPTLLVGLLLITPFASAALLLFRNRVAFFGERYFITTVPWLLIAAGAGALYLADRLPAILGLKPENRKPKTETRNSKPKTHYLSSIIRPLLSIPYFLLPALCYLIPLTFTLIPLPGLWSPSARKEAWRETAGYLATHARPEDAVLIHPDWTRFPLQYYFRGPGQTYAVFGSVDDSTDLEGPLTVINGAHPVVWLVESHTELADPDHRADAWLAARYPEVTELYPPGLVAVRAYAPGYLSDRIPHSATPVSVVFEGGLQLAGYTLPQTRVHATDDLFHPPSGWVHITLYWTAGAIPMQDYTPFVHLIDNLGQVWGTSLERPNDVFDFYPATRWEPDQVVRADFDVNLNPVTPPGNYTLVIGLRNASGVQMPLTDGSPQAPLATIQVAR